MTQELIVSEIYTSIQGESSFAGMPCTFIRLTGCPLRCSWCDTVYAFGGGKAMTIGEVIEKVNCSNVKLVELTGGEPLAQYGSAELMRRLLAGGTQVLIETSGAEKLDVVPSGVHIIMDIKCPDSRMELHNRWENLTLLKATDEIKFVLASRADFQWALQHIRDHRMESRFPILLSCAWGHLHPKELAAWILAEGVQARLQLQQHKYIWGPRAKGV